MTFLQATLQLEPVLQNCPVLHIVFFRLQLSGNFVVPLEEGKTENEPEHRLHHNLSNIISNHYMQHTEKLVLKL